ncbi:hypothetical protein BTRA_2857 [Burkholderia thailandensis USAMRU Malaysia |nr:hypothetical protein BTQ_1169 [Burkholderia thailandensis 2002721723]AHI80171.1 hypothetical protein BTJ_1264 [Burkholderia thailandensis E444]AIC86716.1 hypothetical protein BTRA_2857 [Burkholderia thailandensis USAMRU Malaysia \
MPLRACSSVRFECRGAARQPAGVVPMRPPIRRAFCLAYCPSPYDEKSKSTQNTFSVVPRWIATAAV